MSLNKAMIQFADALDFVRSHYDWIAENVLHIPIGFLCARQGIDVYKAYPMTILRLMKSFGASNVDRRVSDFFNNDIYVPDRDMRLKMEHVFKSVMQGIADDFWLLRDAPDQKRAARNIACMLLALRDACNPFVLNNPDTTTIRQMVANGYMMYLSNSVVIPE